MRNFGNTARVSPVSAIAFVVLLAQLTSLSASAQETETAESADPEAVTVDRSSPRATVRSFVTAMGRFRQGEDPALANALSCLYLDDVPEGERRTKGSELAGQLYDLLSMAEISLESVPTELEDRMFVQELDTDPPVELRIRRYDDGVWRFAYQGMLATLPETIAAVQEQASDEEPPEDPAAEAEFEEGLQSPRAAVELFLAAMNAADGPDMQRARRALDLSQISNLQRDSLGAKYASEIKTVLDRLDDFFVGQIPDESTASRYVLLSDPAGNLIVDVVENPETELKAWKFTARSLETLQNLYDKYRKRELAAGVTETAAVPLGLRLRNFAQDSVDEYAPFLRKEYFSLELWQWTGLFAIVLIGMAISRVLTILIGLLLRRIFARQDLQLDKSRERQFIQPIRIAFMSWIWLVGLYTLGLPPKVLDVLVNAAYIVTATAAVWAAYKLVDILGEYLSKRAVRTGSKVDDLLAPLIARTFKIIVIIVGGVAVVRIIVEDPTELIAGIGLGGLAFALAARETVANIFGSLTILSDQPFQIGDWVVVNGQEGTIETVGMRSTRIRTFYNSLVTVPNSEMITAVIDNYGARRVRRIRTMLSLAYDTPPERIEAFCEGVRELIRSNPHMDQGNNHVYLNQFAASSLDVLLYCFLRTPNWGEELKEREKFFLDILRLAKRLNVEFAFPTQTIHVASTNGAPPDHTVPKDPEGAQAVGRDVARKIASEFGNGHESGAQASRFEAEQSPASGFLDLDSEQDGE